MKCLLVLAVVVGLTSAEGCGLTSPPVWPTAYSAVGVISIPYAELTEPFHAWYDAQKGNSRIDYYDGTAKTFQFSSWPTKSGSQVKIVPETTNEFLNKISCFKTDGGAPGSVTPQPVLPDITNFTCEGHGTINGVQAQKWTQTVQDEEKTNKYVIWIKWQKNENGETIPIPVYYEMKGYNSLIGSHYDHYYLSYQQYKPSAPAENVWKLPQKMDCHGYPGPGARGVALFNPMKEFIHGYDHHINFDWNNFISNHNRTFSSAAEHAMRKHIFKQNHRLVHSHNRADHGYKLALNHLSDRTDDELRVLRGKTQSNSTGNGASPFPYAGKDLSERVKQLPINFDWRLYGAVNPVKDQSICGSCWSFGTTGTIEGAYFVKTGKLISLSEQALIDCSWGYGNNGCDGGEDFRSYAWIMKHGGLPLEDEYGPYLAMDGRCHVNQVKLNAPITGFVNVTSRNEKALKLAIFKQGPISISINAALKTFSFYSHGVFYDPQCKGAPQDLDHSVLAVGYGILDGKKYWLVKNSWSNMWGNDGYILIAVKNNNCGVMTSPTYVIM